MRAAIVCAATCLTTFTLTLVPSPAAAGQPRTHDGFYLSWTLGLGSSGTDTEFKPAPQSPNETIRLSGRSLEGDLAVGSVVRKNLAAHVTLWGWRVSDPKIDDSGNYAVPPGTSEVEGELFATAIGPGLTWFLPKGSRVSASAGLGSLTGSWSGDDTKYKTKSGFAFNAVAGKEWWVGPSAAVGLAGGLQYLSAKDRKSDGLFDKESTWSGFSYSLRFSATFN